MRVERAFNSINSLSSCQPCPEPSLAKPPTSTPRLHPPLSLTTTCQSLNMILGL
ncbi:hypothetical protein BD311DRAFT_764098 [Dichomitus squalens]|uniref:Uncharacterized protein n=1 Tax=Dichomitus squalens TaxID=114155 RepID=A0A4Q9M944_9APHY|nr:hypothetical protein BD311DRAFT_768151 [Dichomitus squalens]TBU25644.1 hypothetical protein BD311DRAFT_764098 [Dichomitus squalens]